MQLSILGQPEGRLMVADSSVMVTDERTYLNQVLLLLGFRTEIKMLTWTINSEQ